MHALRRNSRKYREYLRLVVLKMSKHKYLLLRCGTVKTAVQAVNIAG